MTLPTTNPFSTILGSSLSPGYGSLLGNGSLSGNSLASLIAPSPPALHQWYYVRRRFGRFLENIAITESQRQDGNTKQAGVRAALNRHYWNLSSETAHSLLIGSWGKDTRVRPSRDVDILFLLPAAVYHQYQGRAGNRQSALLQEVKEVLRNTYSQTATMRADGQVVLLPFNSTPVEVAVGFRCDNGTIIYCDSNNGGSYKLSTAEFEEAGLQASDTFWRGNTRALVRMMKQWQRECNVPLKSFQIERLAVEFLATWSFSHYDIFYYDWMVRDFLGFIIARANTSLVMPGTGEIVALGSEWVSKAQTAYRNAVSAAAYEQGNFEALAGSDWQKIFGTPMPVLAQ
jgi:hypothetical protein